MRLRRAFFASIMAAIVVIMVLAVFARFVVPGKLQMPWVESIGGLLLMTATFLGLIYIHRGGTHLVVDIFVRRVNPRLRNILYDTPLVVFMVVFLVYDIPVFGQLWRPHYSNLPIPLATSYLIAATGFVIAVIYILGRQLAPLARLWKQK